MKKYLPLFLLTNILWLSSSHLLYAYDRSVPARMLQEQSYTELIIFIKQVPESEYDAYLLNAAGYAAYQQKQTKLAINYFASALNADSQNVQALLYLGLIARQQKEQTLALRYFKQLTALRPNNPQYQLHVANTYISLAQGDSAFMVLEQAYKQSPNDAAVSLNYASFLIDKERYMFADSILKGLITTIPDYEDAYELLIKSAYERKKYKEVLAYAEKMKMNLSTVSYVPYYYATSAALQLKDYKRSIEFAQLLLANGYETEQVHYYMAMAYAGQKNYEVSNMHFQKCINDAVSTNFGDYHIQLAENLLARRKFADAQKHYDTAAYFSPDAMLHYRKAIAYDEAKQTTLAKKQFAAFLKAQKKADSSYIKYALSKLKDTGESK